MRRKKVIIVISVMLSVILIAVTTMVLIPKSVADYSLIDTQKSEVPVYTKADILSDNLIILGECNGKLLTFRKDISAFYVKDIATDSIFTSGVSIESYNQDDDGIPDKNMYTVCQVGYTDFNGHDDVFSTSSVSCQVEYSMLENGLALKYYFDEYNISITVEAWLTQYGLMARIPVESIVETGTYGVTSITLFPMIGAVANSDSGFIVYPDGSGSLYKFGKSKQSNPISTPFYFEASFNLDQLKQQSRQIQQNIMIPAYGITNGKTAVVSYVTQGDTNGYLTLYPSGFSYNLNRVAAACMYRKSYSYISPSDVEITNVEKDISAGDFAIQYFFLQSSGEDLITYGNFATVIRKFLLETSRIKQVVTSGEPIKANLQVIMGAKSNSGMSTNLKTLTDFSQVKTITEDISDENRNKLRVYLLGWQAMGYGLNPAGDRAASALGTDKDFAALNDYLSENNIESYAVADYVYAMNNGKGFNKSSQAVYNEMNLPITNSDYTQYLLNSLIELNKIIGTRIPYLKKVDACGIAYDKMGYYLYDDYRKDRRLTRLQTASAFQKASKEATNHSLLVAVQGGNAYMLSNVNCIYDLSENETEYTNMAYSIPFYQMIIHGVVSYSGTMPGNMAADYTKQKLKWIEYGSQPYFVLTYNASELLKDTYVTNVFATDYKEQIEAIESSINEFNSKLGFTASEKMLEHEVLEDDVVCVTYESGKKIFINYNNNSVEIDGRTIQGSDYLVCEGGK